MILIFYSDGYLKSRNCRREFLHALTLRKPILVVYDGDDSKIHLMLERFEEIFSVEKLIDDGYGRIEALQLQLAIKAFALVHEDLNESIQWLKVSAFSTESLKLIYMKMLMSLPRSKDKIYKKQLLKGLQLPEEIDPLHTIPFRLQIIVNTNNEHVLALAEEIREMNKIKVRISSCEDLKVEAVNLEEGGLITSEDERLNLRLPSSRISKISEVIVDNVDVETPSDSSKNTDDFTLSGMENGEIVNVEEQTSYFECGSLVLDNDKEHLLKKEKLIPIDRDDVSRDTIHKIFLLHLSKNTFNDEHRALMTESILEAKKENIPIILVHEQDLKKEAAPDFSFFFQHTPQELLDFPNNLYNEIAIPLYTRQEYRQISLHLIVDKIKSSLCVDEEKKGNCWSEICSGKEAYTT